jgi:hypothetical protein
LQIAWKLLAHGSINKVSRTVALGEWGCDKAALPEHRALARGA